MDKYIKINPNDNVVIALSDLVKGEIIKVGEDDLIIQEDIIHAHKIALVDIKEGEHVIKYGYPIGSATRDIQKGEHVHTHNVKTNLSDILDYEYQPTETIIDLNKEEKLINVYQRPNGDIGIRNELWIIPTVGCVNQIAQNISNRFKSEVDCSAIDGVFVFPHPYGCSQMGDDHENTKKTLQNMVKHPNAGGVLVLGLGCENNQVDTFRSTLGEYDSERIKFLVTQEVEDEMTEGVKRLKELYDVMKHDKRVTTSLSKLKIGLKCGGSDGFSGITANPLLGRFSDYIVSHGGTTVLTEVPEMFGAETILMNRAENEAIYNKVVNMINGFKLYYKSHDQVIYDNPSPGNKKGGITTLEDKSLGCTEKAGCGAVVDVLEHGEKLHKQGLNLLSAPGNDIVATTALGVAGCQLVLFTTGRGTPFGGFIPTVKISSNTELANKKAHWIDFDAGKLVSGTKMDDLLEAFINYIVDVVNGQLTNNEKNNFREIAIFKQGVTL